MPKPTKWYRDLVCTECGKDFRGRGRRRSDGTIQFPARCSKYCKDAWSKRERGNRITVTCQNCRKQFETIKAREGRTKYCSAICRRKMEGRQKAYGLPLTQSKCINAHGYVLVYHPEHPSLKGTRATQVLEHRLVMEDKLGRYLEPHESVHHVNGVRHDNRVENLELWSRAHPAGQRVSDLKQIIRDRDERIAELEAKLASSNEAQEGQSLGRQHPRDRVNEE